MKKNCALNNKKGFTLVELIIGIALTAIVMLIVARVMFSAQFVKTGTTYDIKEQGRIVTETIDNAIKYTNAVFTIPKASFVDEKLTATWSYLGVKENVEIPQTLYKSSPALKTRALVHIKSVGSTEPQNLETNQIKIQNGDDGWFIQTILGFDHKDKENGYDIEYSFALKPSSAQTESIASTSIIYGLNVAYYDTSTGTKQKVGESLLDINTEISALNALQVVYQGTDLNPAVALSFHEEAYKVQEDIKKVTKANIMFVLDTSGSMKWCLDGHNYRFKDGKCQKPISLLPFKRCNLPERMTMLKKNSKSFIDEFTKLDSSEVRIGAVEFNEQSKLLVDLNSTNAIAKKDNTFLTATINSLRSGGGTNIGDGLRAGYFNFKNYYSTLTKPEDKETPTFLILVTDGEANMVSYDNYDSYSYDYNNFSNGNYYYRTDCFKWNNSTQIYVGQHYYSLDGKSRYRGTDYMTFAADKFKTTEDFPKPKVYLINVVSANGELDDQTKELMNAFGVTDYKDFVYDVNSDKSFADAISGIVSDIKVSSSLLDGPKI